MAPRSRGFSNIWNCLHRALLLNWLPPPALVSVSPGFSAEVRGLKGLHPHAHMLLQCHSHGGSLTTTNCGRHGKRRGGKLLGFDDPNWLLILVWAPPQTGLTARSFFGRRSRKHQQRSEAVRLGKERSQLIKLVTTAGDWGSAALGDSGEHLPGRWGPYSPSPQPPDVKGCSWAMC